MRLTVGVAVVLSALALRLVTGPTSPGPLLAQDRRPGLTAVEGIRVGSSHPHRAADRMHGDPRREGRDRRRRGPRLGAGHARDRSARSIESRRASPRDRVLGRQRVRARCGERRDEVSRRAQGRLPVRRRLRADRAGRGAVRSSGRRQAARQARRVVRIRGREGRHRRADRRRQRRRGRGRHGRQVRRRRQRDEGRHRHGLDHAAERAHGRGPRRPQRRRRHRRSGDRPHRRRRARQGRPEFSRRAHAAAIGDDGGAAAG